MYSAGGVLTQPPAARGCFLWTPHYLFPAAERTGFTNNQKNGRPRDDKSKELIALFQCVNIWQKG
jgi:hypothetical protein